MSGNIENGREYLLHVMECLKKRLAETDAAILEGEKEIEDMHEYYWENYTEMDEYGYENFDNQQALFRQMNANEEQFLLRKRFKKMMDSPFFGRVDFRYDGDDEPELFYIGIGNLSERAGSLPLVYDWRAPVSGLFYDYDKGSASYEAPSGVFEGEITSKWQYKIRNGKMIYELRAMSRSMMRSWAQSLEARAKSSSKTSSGRSRKSRIQLSETQVIRLW